MKLDLTPSGFLDIESNSIFLRSARPVVNGQVLSDCVPEVVKDEGQHRIVRYTSPELGSGSFTVEMGLAEMESDCPTNFHWLCYWLEGLDPDLALASFGLQFAEVENLRLYLQSGYYSWDGSAYVAPEALGVLGPNDPRPETGFAMTQLLPQLGTNNLILGFDRHDRFQQTFQFDTRRCPPSLTVSTLWDEKTRTGLDRCCSERLVLFEQSEVEDALRAWARIVAQASPIAARVSRKPIQGWSSWYNLYSYINEEIILEHLQGAAAARDRDGLPMDVFQVDDGFTPEMGDWLEVKPQFPRGMQPLLADIRALGFVPGLWIAPFMVGNRSHLFQQHPDWVVQDRHTGRPLVQWQQAGEYRWHKRSEEYYVLDTTHPEAFDYLRRVFRTWRTEWGCDYFKTDFLHFISDHGPDRAVWHTPGLTRIEIWQRTAQMIREEIGEAMWLGSGCPLWASVGLVDGIRIGHDVGVDWSGNISAQSLLRDLATRNFANNILWQIDPDSVLLRERFHSLTEAEVRSLAIYAGMSGGVLITSDSLAELSPERLALWRLVLGNGAAHCTFPLMGQAALFYERAANGQPGYTPHPSDPVLVQVRRGLTNGSSDEDSLTAVFIFNTGEYQVQRTYPLVSLGLSGPLYTFNWMTGEAGPPVKDYLSVCVAPHDGVLFFVGRKPITEKPARLP